MITIKQRLVVLGRTRLAGSALHAVVVLKTTDRDGTRTTEPPQRALCDAVCHFIDQSRRADEMLIGSGPWCGKCREAMRLSREARKNR